MLTERPMPSSWLRGLLAVLFAAAAVQPAHAQSLTNNWSLSQGSTGSISQTSGPLITTHSVSFHPYDAAGGVGTETELSNYGYLSASGSGTGTATAQNGGGMHVGNFANTWIGAVAGFSDVLTIGGTGPVDIQVTGAFDGTSAFTGEGYPDFAFISAFLFVGPYWNTQLAYSGSVSQVLTFNPGQQLFFQGFLSGGCNAAVGNTSPPGPPSAQCSYSGSATFHLDVLTPGGSYSDASGTVYATTLAAVTPEPATLVLLGTGLLGVGAAARRRRKERDAEG